MQTVKENPFTRDDTFFGICEAIGEDFRFHPNFLRIALAVLLFWSPLAALGVYAGLGLLVAFSRLLAPNPRAAAEPEAAVEAQVKAPAAEPVEPVEAEPVALAA